jgi:uncharacterized protein (TIGR00645 family)
MTPCSAMSTGSSPLQSFFGIVMQKIEHFLEVFIFASRWLLAPFYIGLVGAIAVLLFKFVKEFIHLLPVMVSGSGGDVMVGVLTLVDVALVANLLLIIIFAGYENFVSKINTGDHEDRPDWMGQVSFSDLKLKVIGSIVAISGIELLKVFVNVEAYTNQQLGWKVGLHMTFVFSGVMFALMDRLTSGKPNGH